MSILVNKTPVFIIAEAGVNHDGSLEKAMRLVEIAAEAGADAVKFQTFRSDEVVSTSAQKADYQKRQTGDGSQYDMIKVLELSEDDHLRLAEHCREHAIEFMSTPFSDWGLDLLLRLGVKRLKVASGEIVNLPLLRAFARARLPIILSTGMATLEEVERAVGWIESEWAEIGHEPAAHDLVILHCTSDYPAAPQTANLRAMGTIASALHRPIGYSDHTLGDAVSVAAVGLGAIVIEKHFTIDPTDAGPDHAASLDPHQLAAMVRSIRIVEQALGDGRKMPQENELRTRELVRRSAFAMRDIAPGEAIGSDVIQFLRPSGGIGPEQADQLFRSHASKAIPKGALLTQDDLA